MIINLGAFSNSGSSFAGTINLPKTGQTTCYDTGGNVISCDGTGQDGDIQAGIAWPNPRFTDNLDGTMTDNLNGLMWLKDGNCFGTSRIWREALDAVADLNANPESYTCGGYTAVYDDWVLPNINELESLVNAEEAVSATWLSSHGFVNVQEDFYWSSTTYAGNTNNAWYVLTSIGNVGNDYKLYGHYVWPVRATTTVPAQIWKTGQTARHGTNDDGSLRRGANWPVPRFFDNFDGTVTDNLTGLVWLKDAECFGSVQWQEGMDRIAHFNANPEAYACESYTATNADWRLPNRKELHSLTDYSQSNPALPSLHPFLNVQLDPGYYWSSTTNAGTTHYAWEVYMSRGNVDASNKYSTPPIPRYLWPVRGGIAVER